MEGEGIVRVVGGVQVATYPGVLVLRLPALDDVCEEREKTSCVPQQGLGLAGQLWLGEGSPFLSRLNRAPHGAEGSCQEEGAGQLKEMVLTCTGDNT